MGLTLKENMDRPVTTEVITKVIITDIIQTPKNEKEFKGLVGLKVKCF